MGTATSLGSGSAATTTVTVTVAAATAAATSNQANSLSAGLNTFGIVSSDNGPILYDGPNRTPVYDDIRTVVIYIFIISIFSSFIIILPGIRSEKLPTFFCLGTSLTVTSIILISLFGTTWHVGQAESISAPYKAFSRDKIQGDLSVNIGLQSVNITLVAHNYFILHDASARSSASTMLKASSETSDQYNKSASSDKLGGGGASLADELISGRTVDGLPADIESEADDEVFPGDRQPFGGAQGNSRRINRSPRNKDSAGLRKRSSEPDSADFQNLNSKANSQAKFTIERHNVDINYNERFYWIEPNQMRQEHQAALERGLPYPILTVVEYLSQDEAGFSWSRQYRAAGYYAHILLWLALCLGALMFFFHCTAPKYGVYTMQLLGCLLLFTNLTYAKLVPRDERRLVIPFEGQSLSFRFGFNFWLVLFGGKYLIKSLII